MSATRAQRVLMEAEEIVRSMRERGFDPSETATALSFAMATFAHNLTTNVDDGLISINHMCAVARVHWRSFHDPAVRARLMGGQKSYNQLVDEELART